MFNRFGTFIPIAVVAAVATSAPARAADATAVQKLIQAQYDGITRAVRRGDIAAAMAPFAPGFTATIGGQTLKREQLQQMMPSTIAQVKRMKSVTQRIASLKLHGQAAAATVVETAEMVVPGPDHREHHLVTHDTTEDTWVHTASGWKCTRSITGQIRVLMDGKPVATPPLKSIAR